MITIINCLSDISNSEVKKVKNDAGYFVGEYSDADNIHVENSFYRGPSGIAFATPADKSSTQYEASASMLTGGEVTYRLGAGRTGDDNPWHQHIGTDALPQLKPYSTTHYPVSQASGTLSAGSSEWATLCYPVNVSLPSDVIAYAVNGVASGQVALSLLHTSSNAGVPMVLRKAGGIGTISLPTAYFNTTSIDNSGTLKGTYYTATTEDGWYTIGTDGTFKKATGTIPAYTCYLTPAGTLLSSYTPTTSTIKAIISTRSEWNQLCEQYSGAKINITLANDITLTNSDSHLKNFNGTFDGQGHTITLDFQAAGTDTLCVFNKAAGTIQNLHFAGTITVKTSNDILAAPIMGVKTEGLALKNCVSSVNYTASSVMSMQHVAGYIYTLDNNVTVNFTDCAYTGQINSSDLSHTTGFVGYYNYAQNKNVTLSFTNCYCGLTTYRTVSFSKLNHVGYFYDASIESTATISMNNSYALQLSSSGYAVTTPKNVNMISASAQKGGEATYKLNNGRTGSKAVWLQTIGTDAHPQQRTFSAESKEVFTIKGGTLQTGGQWSTLYYPVEVTLPTGVSAYTINSLNDTTAIMTSASTVAGVPVVLRDDTEGNNATITLPVGYYNETTQTGILTGVLADTQKQTGWYTISNSDGTFTAATTKVRAFTCYMNMGSNAVKTYSTEETAIEVTIKSLDEWKSFIKEYSGKKVIARLECDLVLNDYGLTMNEFNGTFDGQGHTVTFNHFVTNKYASSCCMFNYARGEIKNLNMTGTMRIPVAGLAICPLVTQTGGEGIATPTTLNITNCHSDVQFTAENDGNIIDTATSAFINKVTKNSTATFTNCSFTGAFNAATVKNAAPYVGAQEPKSSGAQTVFVNCYSDISASSITNKTTDTDLYVATSQTDKDIDVNSENCYAHATDDALGISNVCGATIVTDSEATSGKVAYLLSDGNSSTWVQTIGTDKAPLLLTFNPKSLNVHKAVESTTEAAGQWATLYYPAAITLPDGVKAYTVSKVEDGTVTLVPADTTALTPLVLHSETAIGTLTLPETYYNEVMLETPLQNLYEDTPAEADWYVLTDNGETATFQKADGTQLKQWQCFLMDSTQTAGSLAVVIDDATGIDAVRVTTADGRIYDLQGRRVILMQKGQTYVKDGKKFIKK